MTPTLINPCPPPRTVTTPSQHSAHSDASNAEQAPADTTELTQARLMTLLPAELLQGGEAIVLLLKPSPFYILLESLRSLATIFVVFAIVIWIYNQGYNVGFTPRDLFLLGFGLSAARLFWQFLEWLSRVYVLTDRRIIRVKGVIRVQVFETQLQQIQHTHTTFSLRERLFGLGSIHFATAGTATNEASWRMLASPLEIHRILIQTLNRYR